MHLMLDATCSHQPSSSDTALYCNLSISSFKVSAANDSIDALICNAGIWIPADGDVSIVYHAIPNNVFGCEMTLRHTFFQGTKQGTADGFEAHFGVNYLANFIIVNGLIENVKKSGEYK